MKAAPTFSVEAFTRRERPVSRGRERLVRPVFRERLAGDAADGRHRSWPLDSDQPRRSPREGLRRQTSSASKVAKPSQATKGTPAAAAFLSTFAAATT